MYNPPFHSTPPTPTSFPTGHQATYNSCCTWGSVPEVEAYFCVSSMNCVAIRVCHSNLTQKNYLCLWLSANLLAWNMF